MPLAHNIGVVFTGNTSSLSSALVRAGAGVQSFEKQVERTSGTVAKTGSIMQKGLAAGVLAVGVAMVYSVAKAIAFEKTMRNVNSISGMSERQLRRTSAAVIEMSTRLPQSANTLAEGLYEIASSGFQGADGLKVLAASGKAASAGITETGVAAKAITAILNAYGLSADDARNVSDLLFQTVNVGVISFEELAGSIGNVIGGAAAAKVNLAQVGGAVSAMTLAGIGGAESMTSLNRLMQAFIKPSDALSAQFRKMGIESGTWALENLGLEETVQRLRVASDGNIETLLQWFPEIRATRGALALMANDGKNYTRTMEAMDDATSGQGATQRAFAEQMKATGAQLTLFKNGLDAAAIKLGTSLLPAVGDLIEAGREAGSFLGDTLAAGLEIAGGAFEAVARFGKAFWDVLVGIGRELGPMAALLVGAGWAIAVTTLQALAVAGENVSKFLLEHPGLIRAVAILLGGMFAASAANAARALVGLARANTAATLSSMVMPLRNAVGGWAALASVVGPTRATLSGIGGAFTSGLIPMAAAAVAAYGVANSIKDAQDQAKSLRRELEKDIDWTSPDSIREGARGIHEELENLKERDTGGGFFDDLRGGLQLFASALPGVEAKMHQVNVAINELSDAEREALGTAAMLDEKYAVVANTLGITSGAVKRFAAEVDIDPMTATYDELTAAIENTAVIADKATPVQVALSEAYSMVSDIASNAEDAVTAYDKAMQALVGTSLELWDAQTKAQESLKGLKDALAKNGGTMNEATEAGRENRDAVSQLVGQWIELGNATARKDGIPAAIEQMKGFRDQLRLMLASSGRSSEDINRIFGELGLLDDTFSALIQLDGADAATAATDELVAGLKGLDGTVAKPEVRIVDATGESRATIDAWILNFAQHDPTTKVHVDGSEARPSQEMLDAWVRRYDDASPTATALLEYLDPVGKFDKLSDLADAWSKETPTATVKVNDQASPVLRSVQRQLNDLDGSSVGVTLNLRTAAQYPELFGIASAQAPTVMTGGRWGMLNYAAGGITPAHVTNQQLIKYGEPETGGEAFIPRRGNAARSGLILDKAASWYGMRVIPMATGGIASGAYSSLNTRNAFASTLGGSALGAAALAAIDPADVTARILALRELADEYYDLADATDEATARQIFFTAGSREDFDYMADAAKDLADRIKESADRAAELREQVAQFRTRANDIRFLVGAMPLDRYLEILNKRLRDAKLFSEEWYAIWQQIRDLQQEAADAAVAALEGAQTNLDTELARLNGMLDEAANIRKQMATDTRTYNDQILEADQRFNEEHQRLIDERTDTLEGWADAGQRVVVTWGNSAAALARNLTEQTQMLSEWSSGLGDLRARGLTDDAIKLLGLDAGPEALGQVRALLDGSAEEIASVNAAVLARTTAANAAVGDEMTSSGSDLAESLRSLAEDHAQALEDMHEDFIERQQDLADDLARVGLDSGRGFADAIAEGLASGLPAILAQVAATQQAMAGVDAAAGTVAATPAPATGSGTNVGPAGHHYIDPAGNHYLRLSGPPVTWIAANGPSQVSEVERLYGPGDPHPAISASRIIGNIPGYFGMGGIREFETAIRDAKYFAKGGVFTAPWSGFAHIGENAGVRPEILTPEALMRSVFSSELRNHGAGSPIEVTVVVDGKIIEKVVTNRQRAANRQIIVRAAKQGAIGVN